MSLTAAGPRYTDLFSAKNGSLLYVFIGHQSFITFTIVVGVDATSRQKADDDISGATNTTIPTVISRGRLLVRVCVYFGAMRC